MHISILFSAQHGTSFSLPRFFAIICVHGIVAVCYSRLLAARSLTPPFHLGFALLFSLYLSLAIRYGSHPHGSHPSTHTHTHIYSSASTPKPTTLGSLTHTAAQHK